jgi:hypothetical protein
MATIQDLFSSFLGNNNIDPAPELQERQNIFQKGFDKVGDTIQDVRFGNPLARTGDITSFVETDKGGTGFTDDGKKVSNLSSAELKFLKERNDELLRAQTGKGQPIISGVRDDDSKFKLYDPLQDYLTGSGDAGAFGNRAAQDMLMKQQVAGEPIIDALLRQKRVEAQAPSLESLRAVAMSPSVAEQEAMQEASKRRQETLDRDERLRAAQRLGDIDVIKAAQMQEFATPTQTTAPQQSLLDQLSPTQLTYAMGQLGYDITPKQEKKQEKKTKPPEADTVEDVTSTSVSTSSTPLGALDLARTFKANFNPSLLSARDLEAYNYALSNPQNPDSKKILVRLGAL